MADPAASLPKAGGGDAKPRHVAIIMDGNGRWAVNKGWPRLVGHRRGAERVKQIVRAGIKAILNFAPVQLAVPADVTVRDVNMAMELEGLSFALSNRGE